MQSLTKAIEASGLEPGGTVSFHHHMRDGDLTMQAGLAACRELGLNDLHLAASSLFPCHTSLIPFVQDGTVTNITTAYMNGPFADFVASGRMEQPVRMTTHGGRARILMSQAPPDLAIIAAPAIDKVGNLGGADGAWACGPLGYAMVDAVCAKHVVAASPMPLGSLGRVCIDHEHVDATARVKTIGNPNRIASGTTARSVDRRGRAMAQDVLSVIRTTGHLRNGLNVQCGAGGVSLEVMRLLAHAVAEQALTCGFVAGGIMAPHVRMLREGLTKRLWNVQSFDLEAVASYAMDTDHLAMSADLYANPDRADTIANQLHVAVLGAAEVDAAFNVNVTTTGTGQIIGGSGGHADIAEGADLSIVVLPRNSGPIPRFVERVSCVTTSGRHVDVVVTEDAICVNPAREDVRADLESAGLQITDIGDLVQSSRGEHEAGRTVAVVEDRRGNVTGEIHAVTV